MLDYSKYRDAQSSGVDHTSLIIPSRAQVFFFFFNFVDCSLCVNTTHSRAHYSNYYQLSEEGKERGVIFYCGWARLLNYMNGWKTSARCHSNCAATSPA